MKTTLHYYYFDIENADEAKQYKLLCKKLNGLGLRCFRSISSDHSKWYKQHIRPLDGKTVTPETSYLFDNQWNTAPTDTSENGLRVFDWAEAIYPNKTIKEGQWLEQAPEMREIRDNTLKCGYCGAMVAAQKGDVFCEKCLDSEYLKEEDLFLLRLRPVSEGLKAKRPPLTDAEKAHLMPMYVERQLHGTNSRNARKLRKQREKIEQDFQKDTESARDKHDGLVWLMDHGVSIDNVIYYDHTQRFCFGWRSPIGNELKSKLLDVLVEFPFDYDIEESALDFLSAREVK